MKKEILVGILVLLASAACVDDSPVDDANTSGVDGASEFDGTPQEACAIVCDWFETCDIGEGGAPGCEERCVEEEAAGNLPFVLNTVATCAPSAGCSDEESLRCLFSLPASTVAACLEANPEGVETDEVAYVILDTGRPPGDNTPPDDPVEVTMADVGATCEAEGGSDCDPSGWLGRGAARCIASEAGMEEGIRPWEIRLMFGPLGHGVAWIMSNTLEVDGAYSTGTAIVVDATSGEVLRQSMWSAQP